MRNAKLCDAVATKLRACQDPMKERTSADYGTPRLKVTRVERVYEADTRGLREVLFTHDSVPRTAFMRGDDLAYITDGW